MKRQGFCVIFFEWMHFFRYTCRFAGNRNAFKNHWNETNDPKEFHFMQLSWNFHYEKAWNVLTLFLRVFEKLLPTIGLLVLEKIFNKVFVMYFSICSILIEFL